MPARTNFDDLDLVIHCRNGRYLAKIPQIGLYATGASTTEVIAAVEDKKRILLDELAAADALDEVSISPTGPAEPMRVLPALMLFSAKAVIVLVLVVLAAGIARVVVQRDVERDLERLHQATAIGGAQFWAQLESGIAHAADPANDLPAAKKEALLAELHIVVERWRPFVREAGQLFSDSTSPQAPKP